MNGVQARLHNASCMISNILFVSGAETTGATSWPSSKHSPDTPPPGLVPKPTVKAPPAVPGQQTPQADAKASSPVPAQPLPAGGTAPRHQPEVFRLGSPPLGGATSSSDLVQSLCKALGTPPVQAAVQNAMRATMQQFQTGMRDDLHESLAVKLADHLQVTRDIQHDVEDIAQTAARDAAATNALHATVADLSQDLQMLTAAVPTLRAALTDLQTQMTAMSSLLQNSIGQMQPVYLPQVPGPMPAQAAPPGPPLTPGAWPAAPPQIPAWVLAAGQAPPPAPPAPPAGGNAGGNWGQIVPAQWTAQPNIIPTWNPPQQATQQATWQTAPPAPPPFLPGQPPAPHAVLPPDPQLHQQWLGELHKVGNQPVNYQHLVLQWLPGMPAHCTWNTIACRDVGAVDQLTAGLLGHGYINDTECEEYIISTWTGPPPLYWRDAPPIVEVQIDTSFSVPKKKCLACSKWMSGTHHSSEQHKRALLKYNNTQQGWMTWQNEIASLFTTHWRLAGR